ncbi:MAG: MGMT family protein [Candidatus Aenigmarchaeota archaeon]|nr:MGMT family protein [Candidatus Aenigmarchaeota archaeon]
MVHKAILLLRKIPKGKVTTYGELARATKSSPRAIGQIMKRNEDPEIYPCYKVVSSSGAIGGYAGCVKGKKIDEKISKLNKDGIKIINGKIDLKKHLHKF